MDLAAKRRLDELMPWYVTGRIAGEDRAWVEAMLREHPQAQAELEWHRRLQEQIHARFDRVPQDVGLPGLMARVRAERRAEPGERSGWLRGFFASLGARPAYAFAAALIVVQAGVIGALLLHEAAPPEYGETRALAPQPVPPGPVLQVTFKSDITERDLRLLLIRVGGRVIDGPGQLGDYLVAVPPERIEPAREELEQSGLVDSVTVVTRPPERD